MIESMDVENGVRFVLGLAFVLACDWVYVRAIRRERPRLPPNTSGGKPVPTTRERVLFGLFCVFLGCVIAWLLVGGP
jgi:hypothetical protein